MKNNRYRLNIILALAIFLFALAEKINGIWHPLIDMPALNVPAMTALALAALLADSFLGNVQKREWLLTAVFACASYALIPACAGLFGWDAALMQGLKGGAAFAVCTLLFDGVSARVSTLKYAQVARVVCAAVMFLAAQITM